MATNHSERMARQLNPTSSTMSPHRPARMVIYLMLIARPWGSRQVIRLKRNLPIKNPAAGKAVSFGRIEHKIQFLRKKNHA